MSRYFVTDPPVAIYEFDPTKTLSDALPNVIYIRARMDVETKGKVSSELFTLGDDSKTLEARLGANETALLLYNIVRWEGPDLGSVPCTPENIRHLDPTEPHIAKVLEEIALRNKAKPSPNARSAAPGGSTSATAVDSTGHQERGENVSLQLATTPLRSPLRSAITGHHDRSENSTPITSKS